MIDVTSKFNKVIWLPCFRLSLKTLINNPMSFSDVALTYNDKPYVISMISEETDFDLEVLVNQLLN